MQDEFLKLNADDRILIISLMGTVSPARLKTIILSLAATYTREKNIYIDGEKLYEEVLAEMRPD